MTNASDLINESVADNAIVTVSYGDWRALGVSEQADLVESLDAECEDSAESGSVLEYWGTDDEGGEWRVHLVTAPLAGY